MITEPVQRIKSAVEQHFHLAYRSGSLWDLGVFNCRTIAGSDSWSQHAWGNAYDIGVSSLFMGDQVYAYLLSERQPRRLPIGRILWRVRDHFDHIHVEGSPEMDGIPPCTRKDEMSILSDKEQRELQKFLENIKSVGSNVNFVRQTIADARERNVQGPWAPLALVEEHLQDHPSGGVDPDHHHRTGPPLT